MPPSYPVKGGEGVPFSVTTQNEKTVADYAGCSLFDVYEMELFTFWALLHDAIVFACSQTEKGREWLHNAWRLTQTEPDDAALRRKYGRKEV